MSKVKVNQISPRSGTTITIGESGDSVVLGSGATQTGFGTTFNPFRNLIINGDMSITQRGTSFSSMSNGQFITDRFFYDRAGGGVTAVFTGSQSTDVPSGTSFANSLKMDVTTAQTLGASGGTYLGVTTKVEGYNYKLTSNQVATISFWVKSNLTGTYSIVFRNNGNDRVLVEEYTINSASTWEKKTITLPTFTTDGTWNYTNGMGVSIFYCLAVAGDNDTSTIGSWISSGVPSIYGSSNNVEFASSTSNEWYITGVQLEVGTTASDFEFLPFDVNLQRCNRYYFKYTLGYLGGIGKKANTGSNFTDLEGGIFPCEMRANPSVTFGTPTYENCSSLSVTPVNGKTFLARVTASGTYRCYETDVEFDSEL